MTRNDQVAWWRQGFDAGRAAAQRELAEDVALAAAVRQAESDRQRGVGQLLEELIGVLAHALLDEHNATGTGPGCRLTKSNGSSDCSKQLPLARSER